MIKNMFFRSKTKTRVSAGVDKYFQEYLSMEAEINKVKLSQSEIILSSLNGDLNLYEKSLNALEQPNKKGYPSTIKDQWMVLKLEDGYTSGMEKIYIKKNNGASQNNRTLTIEASIFNGISKKDFRIEDVNLYISSGSDNPYATDQVVKLNNKMFAGVIIGFFLKLKKFQKEIDLKSERKTYDNIVSVIGDSERRSIILDKIMN